MNIKNIYPHKDNNGSKRRRAVKILYIPFLVVALASVIVNIIVGGPAWSAIVLMGLYMIWNLFVSTDLIEYNRISQFTKAVIYACIIIYLIEVFIVGGWAYDVITIVTFGSIIVSGVIFYTNFHRQKHNMYPLLKLIVIGIIWCFIGFFSALEVQSWPLIVLGCATVILLSSFIIALRGDFIRELKCRLHIK